MSATLSRTSHAFHCRRALLPDGWREDVRIEHSGGLITSVTANAALHSDDIPIEIALPGMANLHSHAFQRGMAGLAERRGPTGDSFWTWRELMYRFVERLGPDELQAIAAMAYIEMLEAGFTRVAEFHYLHHRPDGGHYDDPAENCGRIAAAAEIAGIGLTLLPVFYAQGGFGAQPAGAPQERFLNNPDSYARLIEGCGFPGVTLGIAPHSLRAVTLEQLHAILPLAAGGPVHIHIAEQQREVLECVAWDGRTPVRLLLDEFPVNRHWCLVHATHLDDNERIALAANGAVAGLCPITEANLGDGLFPLPEFMADGGMIGVGSDSNVLIDLGEELRLLEYGQRLTRKARNVAALAEGRSTGRALFDAALAGGAQACGVMTGLVAGAPADLVGLDPGHAALLARDGDSLLDSLIFARGAVDEVWRGGVRLVAEGRHIQRDAVMPLFAAALLRTLA